MKSIPNILTIGRLVLTLAVLACLALAARTGTGDQTRAVLQAWAFVGFVVAAITDFFDGWLARKLGAESLLGAILDPIADKALVAGAIVGLLAVGVPIALSGGLILFREFAVSALRETLAPKGLRLPVTLLAKWKTTLQLVALAVMLYIQGARGLMILIPGFNGLGLACYLRMPGWALDIFWLAAAITLWTGAEYALSARKALKAQQ